MSVARDGEGRLVVVKRGDPGRLRREAAALAAADGAGCVDLVELAEDDGGDLRLTTTWVGGGSLATALPLGPTRTVAVLRDLARSLARLHGRGVVHGRVAAEHVLLDGDRPVLCGFGEARLPGEVGGPTPDVDVAAFLELLDGLADGTPGALAARLRGVGVAGGGGGAAAVADRLGALLPAAEPARRELRPRVAPPPARRAPVRGLIASVVGALVLLGLAVHTWREGAGSDAAPATTSTVEAPCRPATAPAADVDGDGCAEELEVAGGTVTAGGRRWQVGERGDLAAVADWDCDGRATAAVVRPASGEVWVYDGWASDGRTVTARPGPAAPGATAARAVPGRDGCSRLEVTTAGAGRRLLDLA